MRDRLSLLGRLVALCVTGLRNSVERVFREVMGHIVVFKAARKRMLVKPHGCRMETRDAYVDDEQYERGDSTAPHADLTSGIASSILRKPRSASAYSLHYAVYASRGHSVK